MGETFEQRISLAIQILDYAITNNKSLGDACYQFNKPNNYLRDIRRRTNTDKLSAAEKIQFANFISKYNEFLNEATEMHDATSSTTQTEDEKLADKDTVVDNESTETTETDDTLELDHRGNRIIKTVDQLIEDCKVDLDKWKIDKEVVNKWDVAMKMKNDAIETAQNFQIKIWLSKRKENIQVFDAAAKYKELVEQHQRNPDSFNLKYTPNLLKGDQKNLLEIAIFDLHVGKLCWSGETGENYDVKIATKRFGEALSDLLDKASKFKFERILFPIGNDFFNSDTILNTTTEGTPQDEDLRWQKTFKIGVEILVNGINLMRQFAPVDVVVIPGNHDFTRSFYLGETISAWYRNEKDVRVDTHASPRKYYRYGKVLLGLTHGNNEKEGTLLPMMTTEVSLDYAETEFREFHLGHFHKQKTVKYKVINANKVTAMNAEPPKVEKQLLMNEEFGVTVRYLSSLTGKDGWHHKKGYVGSLKAAQAFLWNYDEGLISQFNVNIIDEHIFKLRASDNFNLV